MSAPILPKNGCKGKDTKILGKGNEKLRFFSKKKE